jgi:hypothetical protein
MNRRTRIFVFVAAGILVAGLGTGLVASYVGLQNLPVIGGNGPAEFAYVPVDASIVAYANVHDIMASELRRKLDAIHPQGTSDGARSFQEHTGIDLEKDIDYVVAAVVKTPENASGPPLILARGRLDQARIEALATQQGASAEDYQGARVVTRDQFAVAFLEPGLVAVGGPAAVRKALDTKSAGGQNASDNDELMRLVRDVDDGTVWAVARFDALTSNRLPPDVQSKLPKISWFSGKGAIGAGVDGVLRVEAIDDASAQDLRQVIQGFMALARMQTGNQAGLTELLNSLQLGGEGKTVSLTFSLPPEILDALGAIRAQRPRLPQLPPETPIPPVAPDAPRAPTPPAL